ncbi:MAG: Hsp70 family protein [Polyangiaceae bacterium]|nr:Hsp70 family protein [Polyangiaceae bacterium]
MTQMLLFDRAVGIDLGTTNSEIAMLVPSEREILVYEDRFGRKTVPSAVAWDKDKQSFVVGRPARARRGKDPAPVESIKRRMGQHVQVSVGPHELTPEEISAKILAELRASMTTFLADRANEGVEMRVDRAVITVPAYFDAPQIEATRRAGELAGLGVVGIIQEPTAAAIYHTYKRKIAGGNFLVYDLGGGTFDVSILRCIAGEYQVLAIDGDNLLGGDDFDRRFAEHLRKALVKRGYKLDLDVLHDPADRARFLLLVHLAQEIKESLSTAESVNVSRSSLFEDKEGESVSLDMEITRSEYEATIDDLVESTIECSKRAIEESMRTAGVGAKDIDHVVLVGGSTRVPLVRRKVMDAICSQTKNAEPLADEVDTIVALGAAIHGAQVGGLSIEDQERALRIGFASPLVATSARARVAIRVERTPKPAASLSVAQNGAVLAEAMVLGEDKPARVELTLEGSGDAELSAIVRDEAGEEIGSVPFVLYRGDARPRASALSRASVIAKEIGIEVVRAGRRERRVLMAKGAGLPTETKHTFYTADQSGTVVLRLLQGRMPIKTLAVNVSREVAIGTPVELTLKCDEAMRVEARAVVAGQELWATVTPAEQAKFEQAEVVDELLAEAERSRGSMWGHAGDIFRREVDQLSSSIRETLQTDPAKLSALCARLRRLLDDVGGDAADPLQPPMHLFEAELDSLRRVVYRAQGVLVGLDRDAWEDRIRGIEERAMEAHAALDASAWRRTFNEVQALYETAIQEEFAARRLDDPAYVQMRSNSTARWRTRVERALVDFTPSTSDELRTLQTKERDRLLDGLRTKVALPMTRIESGEVAEPNEVRRLLDQCDAELERIDAAMERLPSLGLVTERGGSSGRA